MKESNTEQKKVILLNRLLGSTKFIVFCCVFVSIFFFFLANYILNFISDILPIFLNKIKNPNETSSISYFSFKLIGSINKKYWQAYIILFVLLIFANIFIVVKIRTAFHEYNIGQKGTQKFETIEQLRRQHVSVKMDCKPFQGSGGLPIAYDKENNAMLIDNGAVNALVIGVTRSGKLHDIIAPLIDIYSRASEKADLIILDPKLELFKLFRDILESRGTETILFNLIEPSKSSKRNLFADCIDAYNKNELHLLDSTLNSIAVGIFNTKENSDNKDEYFTGGAQDLFKACIYALIEECKETPEKINIYSALNLVGDLSAVKNKDGTTDLHKYFLTKPSGSRARMAYNAVISSDGSQADTVATFNRKLSVFQNQLIAHLTSDNEIDFNRFGNSDKPCALFIGVPDYDKSFHFVSTLLIQQISKIVSKNASNQQKNKNPRETVFLLEELGNAPPIEGLDSLTSVGLGRNIRYILILQSLAQLKKQYGEYGSEIIMDNCSNQYFIKTNHHDTAEYFSKAIGSETITNITRTGKRFEIDKTITENYEERRLLDANEIKQFNYGEMVLLRNMKTSDNDGNDIKPLPVLTRGEMRMPLASTYIDLPDEENLNLGKYENYDISKGKSTKSILIDTSFFLSDADTVNARGSGANGGITRSNENTNDNTAILEDMGLLDNKNIAIKTLDNFTHIKLALERVIKLYQAVNVVKNLNLDFSTIKEVETFLNEAYNDGIIQENTLKSFLYLFAETAIESAKATRAVITPPSDTDNIKVQLNEKTIPVNSLDNISNEEWFEFENVSELENWR